ncbi:TlpA family protein disulfide reductase [Bordetella sp. 02P26C-1]|uniref:TlpA family protein disulfide reductase n=1 Tax=Bordetella sp. 02P26C-1 TaxID=2683195 RepID=UPI0013549AA0|nr:TlpA disulfide reductase family protein [Bordetella sp. 02P26C-1]MVW78314.1 redoxin domain-containing protein [Bordetella sp. 02P26C-1]
MNRRFFLYTGAAVVAAAAGGLAYRRTLSPTDTSDGQTSSRVSAADAEALLWNLKLPDLDGATQRLDQWRGRAVVINFWATWCAPCVKEMPELQSLHEKYPSVQFVGIGIDKVEKMREFVQKIPVSYPLLVMGSDGIDTLRKLGNAAGGLPFTVILQADGGISRKILGQIQYEDLDRSLQSLST